VSEHVLESSGLSLSLFPETLCGEVNDVQVGSWRDCFVMSLCGGDVYSRGVMRWTVYPTPCTGLRLTTAH
jgi:hypothetical protein